jgi:hypothetical protein
MADRGDDAVPPGTGEESGPELREELARIEPGAPMESVDWQGLYGRILEDAEPALSRRRGGSRAGRRGWVRPLARWARPGIPAAAAAALALAVWTWTGVPGGAGAGPAGSASAPSAGGFGASPGGPGAAPAGVPGDDGLMAMAAGTEDGLVLLWAALAEE